MNVAVFGDNGKSIYLAWGIAFSKKLVALMLCACNVILPNRRCVKRGRATVENVMFHVSGAP